MPEPTDPAQLERELAATAQRRRELLAELDAITQRRDALVADARDRRIMTWKRLASMFDMTEEGLRQAVRRNRA